MRRIPPFHKGGERQPGRPPATQRAGQPPTAMSFFSRLLGPVVGHVFDRWFHHGHSTNIGPVTTTVTGPLHSLEIAALSSADVATLTPAQLRSIAPADMAFFNTEALLGFSSAQLNVLTTTQFVDLLLVGIAALSTR